MPLYEFECADCGVFEGARPMSRANAPWICPNCGQRAPRVLSAVAIGHAASKSAASAAVPRLRRASSAPAASARPKVEAHGGHRPWMIGH
jgi:putative FmdB family regulatory protein